MENDYRIWTVVFYVFYGIGWLVTVVGIYVDAEIDAVVEAVAEKV
jgi:hypothetical protein